MKRMKLFTLLLLTMLSLGTFVNTYAQQGPQQNGQRRTMTEEEVKERSAKMAEQLKATDEQAKKMEAIDLEFYKKMQVERQNAGGDREAMRETMQTLSKERDEKYAKVLTAEQMKEYERIREEQRQQRQLGREGGQGGRPTTDAPAEQRTRGRN